MKTGPTKASVAKFIAAIADPERRKDSKALLSIMRRITGRRPVLWGDSIVGFGAYAYRRADSKTYQCFRTGFSPRKAPPRIYIMPGCADFKSILKRLGPHRLGKSCLYLKRLADVDPAALEALIAAGYADINRLYPPD